MNILLFTIQGVSLFFLSLCLTACSEIFWHKYLFHSKKSILKKILTEIWHYDIDRHTKHHKLCFNDMHDKVHSVEEYDVQKLSNVYVAAILALLIQYAVVYMFQLNFIFYIISFFTVFGWFTFWFLFEDHFHKAMHKPEYYELKIKNTWQAAWFSYVNRMHTLHHRFPDTNFGFVFFPIGDFFFRTYRHTYESCLKRDKKQ